MATEATNDTAELELWVMVDEEGDYEIAKEQCDLAIPEGLAGRMVKVTLRVPLPKPMELVGTVAAEPAGGELVAG